MKIETQVLEDHQAKLTVEVEPERLDSMKQRAAAKLAKKVRVPGFRPGKAPYHVIVKQIGEGAILEEAVELLVDEIYPEVIEQAEIKPYGPGKLEKIASTEPMTLEFVIPLEAQVELGDYQSIRRPYAPDVVTDEDVERVVRDLQDRQAILEPAERPVQPGDLATVRLSAERQPTAEDEAPAAEDTAAEAGTESETSEAGDASEAAEPAPAKDLTLIRERSMPLVVYEAETPEAKEEWPFPGFTSQLIGMNAGEEKTIEYTWPEDAAQENLRGTTATFHFTLENVKERQLPEVNDEFVQTLEGDLETVDELRKNIREMLEQQSQQGYNQGYDDAILEQAVEMSTFHYPPQMLEREIDVVIDDLEHRLEHQNMDMDLYLKSRGMDQEALRAEVKPVAENRIKRSLFLSEFSRAMNIQIPPEELQQEAMSTLSYLYNSLPKKDQKKLANRDVYNNIVSNVLIDLMSRRSLERFRDLASGKLEQDAMAEVAAAETPLAPGQAQESASPAGEAAADEAPAAEEQPAANDTTA